MKALTFKLIILLLVSFFFFSSSRQGNETEKIIEKSLKVDDQTVVHIINKHGDINVFPGRSDKVEMEVKITTHSGSKNARETFLKECSIDFSTQGNHFYAISNPKSQNKGKYWWNRIMTSPVGYKIHYKLNIPPAIEIELDNKYGNINLGDHKGKLYIKNSYGDIQAEDLNSLTLELKYGKGKIKSSTEGDIKLAYSVLEMDEMPVAEINSRQSKVSIGKSSELSVFSKYDKYTIGSVNSLFNEGAYDKFIIDNVDRIKVISKYSGIEIDKCGQKLESELTYGSLKVNEFSSQFSEGIINSKYTDIFLYKMGNHHLSFKGKYTGVDLKDGYVYTNEMTDGSEKNIEATYGSNNPLPRLSLDMKYGKLVIK